MFEFLRRQLASLLGTPPPGRLAFHPSQTCPECGSKLCREAGTNAPWLCPNLDCPAQIRRRLAHWCSPGAMDIPADDALIAGLVWSGLVRNVAELYRLKLHEIAALEFLDANSGRAFFETINASRSRDAWRVLHGLGVPHVDADAARSLVRHFSTLDQVFSSSAERLQEAEGVSEAAALGVVHWHSDPENRRLLRRLERAGVNFGFGRGLMNK